MKGRPTMSDRPTADDLRATVDDRRSIHSPDCWQRHPACALLLACDELDRLALLVLDQQAERERDEAVEALREKDRRIAEVADRLAECANILDRHGELCEHEPGWSYGVTPLATMREAVEALRTVASFHDPNPHTGDSHCWECRNPWPCPTIRLIGGTDE